MSRGIAFIGRKRVHSIRMNFEHDLSREIAKVAAKVTASQRFGRPLTKDEEAFYESKVDQFYDLIGRKR